MAFKNLESMISKPENVTVSIITAVKDDLAGLRVTEESVLSQTHPVTWIIVDADSGSETRMYLSKLKSKKHHILWKSEKTA